MHGTGGEDYFSQGWGMQKNAYPFAGSIVHEEDVPQNQVSYRWHLADPVRFNTKIKVTMETGHANHLRDDWATTAYWYQTLPGPKLKLPPVGLRIPRKATIPKDDVQEPDLSRLTTDQAALVQSRNDRFNQYLADRQIWLDRRSKDSQERASKNVEIAKDLRARWLASLGH